MRWFPVFGLLILVLVQVCVAGGAFAQSPEASPKTPAATGQKEKWVRPDWAIKDGLYDLVMRTRDALAEEDCATALALIDAIGKKKPVDRLAYHGKLMEAGRCLPHDPVTAFSLLREAEKLGHPGVWPLLGYMYLKGLGTARDPGKASFWFQKTALGLASTPEDERNSYLERTLGHHGIPDELREPMDWLRSVDEGGPEAKYGAALRVEAGKDIPRECNPAKWWLLDAAMAGHVLAQFELANWYFEGNCTEKDSGSGSTWMFMAARNGFAAAQADLGRRRMSGRGTDRQPVLAYAWLLRARQGGVDVEKELAELRSSLDQDDISAALRWAKELKELPP